MVTKKLIIWYRQHRRELPWRGTNDPYKIWLSEVILQQTRVAQGLPYYLRFVETFPTVQDLARATEQKVLRLWQGLGYYSRARNMRAAAKQIIKEHNGKFPRSYAELKKLKGVGDYTAAAISSICFNAPHAVVDGNVYRVLSRLYAISTPINTTEGKKIFAELANQLLDKKNAGEYNQAIMEFGALHCTPAKPGCAHCPLEKECLSATPQKAIKLPVKHGKVKIKHRYIEYFYITRNKKTFINLRTGNDIWKGLYELPALEFTSSPSPKKVLKEFNNKLAPHRNQFKILKINKIVKHTLSHQQIVARFWHIELTAKAPLNQYREISISELKKYPFPVLISRHLKDHYI